VGAEAAVKVAGAVAVYHSGPVVVLEVGAPLRGLGQKVLDILGRF